MSSVAFAQTQEKQEAYKFFEFEKTNDSLLKEKFMELQGKLSEPPNAQGYIINYGTARQIAKREKRLINLTVFCKLDASRITFVRGGEKEKSKTEFWIVPAGAELPKP